MDLGEAFTESQMFVDGNSGTQIFLELMIFIRTSYRGPTLIKVYEVPKVYDHPESISFYVVLRAGRAQFGIFAGFSRVFFTLCSTRSGPCAIWDFWRSF